MTQAIDRIISFNSLENQKFFVTQCKFGYGVFANLDIKKGEEILRFTGSLIDFKQAVSMGDKQGNALQVSQDIYLDSEAPARFINHSCEPNIGIKSNVVVVAIKDIKRGEEIYFDYSTTMDEDYWTMQCGCGSKHCRKTIKDFKHLPLEVKRKYLELNIVQQFIANKYQKMLTNV